MLATEWGMTWGYQDLVEATTEAPSTRGDAVETLCLGIGAIRLWR